MHSFVTYGYLENVCRNTARLALAVLSVAFAFGVTPALSANAVIGEEPRRLAFVVGIGEYDNLGIDQKKLTRAVRDAVDVGKSLEGLGFVVVDGVGKDIERDGFMAKWKRFVDKIEPGRNDTVVIFLSGHGMGIEGRSYFLTRNAPFKRAGRQGELEREAILLTELLLDLEKRQPRLVLLIVDACRTNPFIPSEFRAVGLGGTSMTGDGVRVVYSAGRDEIALDRLPSIPQDTNPNSVFTRALLPMLQRLKSSEVPLYLAWTQSLQKEVREIARSAGLKQSPKAYSGLEGEFCLLGECKGQIKSQAGTWTNASSSGATACDVWSSLKNSVNEGDLLDFVARFRGQECARYAKVRLDTLSKSRSTLRVISIGISRYADKRWDRLKFSSRDASALTSVIEERIGSMYRSVEVQNLVDATGTRRNILNAFNIVRLNAKPSDTLLVFLSGYTIDRNGRGFFIPSDARYEKLDSYVDLSGIQRMISSTFGRRIILFDSGGELMKSQRSVFLDNNGDDQITVMLAATPPSQAALFDHSAEGHSLFTDSILRGLSGEALPVGGSEITINDLARFVSQEMRLISERMGRTQRSYLVTDDGNFILSRFKK